MNTKLEGVVKEQSKLLKEQMPSLLAAYQGKFVAFFGGTFIIAESHRDCFAKAEKQFGDKGFVIDQVTSLVPMISALVKLK